MMLRLAGLLALLPAAPLWGQSVPLVDTEDATLSSVSVGGGGMHPILTLDVRNGDYARATYDQDGPGVDRVPVHATIGLAVVLDRDAAGRGRWFLTGQSSNGFHAPSPGERSRPRAFYESNTIAALAWRPVEGLTAALAYAVKTSPNGVDPTTQEASVTMAWTGKDALGDLGPNIVVTRRTQGDGGFFTLASLSPSQKLGEGEDAAQLSLPLAFGMGWDGFYGEGLGDRAYGSAGFALSQPLTLGGAKATLRAEILALIRDGALAASEAPNATSDRIIPLATLSLRMGW
ncbi:hypothetical protein [Sphingomonas sp. 2378]|uniref:hypothetical protein n=1 Tax=Sphingomonas sp. 2378 TaxID=1219748 RepID=UPI00311AD35E